MKKLIICLAVLIGLTSMANAGMSRKNWKSILPGGKLIQVSDNFVDLAADASAGRMTVVMSTATLVAGATSWTTTITEMPEPRNVVVAVTTTSATMAGTFVIEGTSHRGNSTTETLVIAGTTTVTGAVAWRTIDTGTLTMTSISGASGNMTINIGTGEKIGLGNELAYTDDIVFVDEAGTKTTTYTANATYDTIDFATDGDGSNDYKVYYYTPMW